MAEPAPRVAPVAPLFPAELQAVAAAFSVAQLLELIALVGFYHTVSFLANGLRLPPERYAAPFPEA